MKIVRDLCFTWFASLACAFCAFNHWQLHFFNLFVTQIALGVEIMCTCSAFFFNEADFFQGSVHRESFRTGNGRGSSFGSFPCLFPVFAGDMTRWAPDALITNYPTYSLVLNERNAVGPQLGSVRLRFVSLSLLNTEVLHLVDGWLSISPALCQTADF